MAVYGGSVYIITNSYHSVLYIGVTSNLIARILEHRDKIHPSAFSARYGCWKLVYFENFSRIEEAIAKEKMLKKWKREWKNRIISQMNPGWIDLFNELE